MLELKNFGDQSFEEVFEYVMKQMRLSGKEWNNTQLSDPGITLLEMFSWLKVLQIRKMKDISNDTLYQFLKLLDVKVENNKPSRTLIQLNNVKHNMIVPKGTKWSTEGIVFENEQPIVVDRTNVVKLCFENAEDDFEKTAEELNGDYNYYIFGEDVVKNHRIEQVFTICLDGEIPNGAWLNIYFDVSSEYSKRRNPVKVGDNFVEMADIDWEYYGTFNGVTGWHKVDFIVDRTHRFLYSDIISFKVLGNMQKNLDSYCLRATLRRAEYDYFPTVRRVMTNVFPVVQKDTVCEKTILKGREIKNDKVVLESYLALYGEHKVYIAEDNSWIEQKDFSINPDIETGSIEFDLKDASDRIADINDARDAVMIISYIKDRIPGVETVISSSNGYASQRIEHFDSENIYYDDFDIIVGKFEDEHVSFDIWNKVYSFFSSNKYDKHYIFDWENETIKFGNNEMGKAPDKLENGIRLAQLSYTLGKNGNIKSERIKFVESENEDISSLKINQIVPAVGGKDSVIFSELKNSPLSMFNNVGRAVTVDDYYELVRNTPGLIVENIKILPGYLTNVHNPDMDCVTVAVQQGNEKVSERCLANYSENISNYLDKYRLINTKIDVVKASYVGIEISGDIFINSVEKGMNEILVEKIENFVSNLNHNLGQMLCFGDLFGTIECIDGVRSIRNLNINPVGDYEKITKSGDIVVHPNGCYYVKSVKFNYLKSLNL